MSNTTETTTAPKESCCAPTCCEGEAKTAKTPDIHDTVKQRYGNAVTAVTTGGKASCCGSSASAGVSEGEVVLDLGSGGGIDVLLSAKRAGPTGKAYGLDMTDEMLALAQESKEKAGAKNVEFLKGNIEAIPLPAKSVDVIISNCVVNLSPDKDQVLREAFRVLKPGGRFAVSDIVIRLPPAAKKSMELWTGCIAGALMESEYLDKLTRAGFSDISVQPTATAQS